MDLEKDKKSNFDDERLVEIKTYSKKELRGLYGVSKSTFNSWLRRLGFKLTKSNIFTPKEVARIFAELGKP